jgi:hypothetical protein
MGEGAAQESDILHVSHADVGNELATAAQITVILSAQNGTTNAVLSVPVVSVPVVSVH